MFLWNLSSKSHGGKEDDLFEWKKLWLVESNKEKCLACRTCLLNWKLKIEMEEVTIMRKKLCGIFDRQLKTCLKNKQPFKEKHVYSDESLWGIFYFRRIISCIQCYFKFLVLAGFPVLPSIISYVFNESLWVAFSCPQQKLKAGNFSYVRVLRWVVQDLWCISWGH